MAELAVTVFVVLLVIGATKIPALGDAIGRRLRGPAPLQKPKQEKAPLSPPERASSR